jgi:predicted outer membrane protein
MKFTALIFLLSGSIAFADTKLSDPDAAVVAHLHAVDQTEIMAGKLAQKNGTAAGKSYGMTLVKDHTDFDGKLTAFAKKHGVSAIPADATTTAGEKKDMDDEMTKLKGLTGSNFDKEIGTAMAAAHDKENAKADPTAINDKDLAAMIKALKPTLQAHADAARKLAQ